jgi:hypothetical protein
MKSPASTSLARRRRAAKREQEAAAAAAALEAEAAAANEKESRAALEEELRIAQKELRESVAREHRHTVLLRELEAELQAQRKLILERDAGHAQEEALRETNAIDAAELQRQRSVMNKATVLMHECVGAVCIYLGKMDGQEAAWRERQQSLRGRVRVDLLSTLAQVKECLEDAMKRLSIERESVVRGEKAVQVAHADAECMVLAKEAQINELQQHVAHLEATIKEEKRATVQLRNECHAHVCAEQEARAAAEALACDARDRAESLSTALSDKESIAKVQLGRLLEYIRRQEELDKEKKAAMSSVHSEQRKAKRDRQDRDRHAVEAIRLRADMVKLQAALRASHLHCTSLQRQARYHHQQTKGSTKQGRPHTAPCRTTTATTTTLGPPVTALLANKMATAAVVTNINNRPTRPTSATPARRRTKEGKFARRPIVVVPPAARQLLP